MKNLSRILAILMTLAMVFGLAATAFAAEGEYEKTDAYVLNYTGEDIEGYEDYSAKRLYASDHYAGLYVDEDGDGTMESDWNWTCCSVLNMINTTVLPQGGEGPYATIPVYCVDAITDGVPGYNYRRVNLEDAGYFSDEVAGRLRAIFLNSYPYITDMAALAAAVNAWDASAGVENLTESEAITATQIAIWDLANTAEVYAPYLGTGGYYEESEMVPAYLDIFRQEATEHTEKNITALYHYLMDLDAVAPRNTVISQAAFGSAEVSYTKQEDGTYTATVTAEVTASVDSGDALSLTAVCSGRASQTLEVADGTNSYALVITGLESDTGSITLNIDGQQNAADVFLFDPLNGREASQTMMGYDDSTLPVHAELTLNVLNIHKYSPVEGDSYVGKTPLANITFHIYYVGSLEDYLNGRIPISDVPTDADVARYATAENLVAAVTTDADGLASYNFGDVKGVYLVVEQKTNTVVTTMQKPFFVAVPYVDENGIYDYIVDVYPKNDILQEKVEIEKDVTEIDNDSSTYDVNEEHTWIIQSSIPAGIASGRKYEITDALDYRLTWKEVTKVSVAYDNGTFDPVTDPADKTEDAANAETFILTAEEDYKVVPTKDQDAEGNDVDKFIVSLTPAGMQKIADYVGNDYDNYELRIYFKAAIDQDAQLGVNIPNQARVDYTNALDQEFEDVSDIPEVHTGGMNLLKLDAADETVKLAGAQFRLAEKAEGETWDAVITVKGEAVKVNYVSFYTNAGLEGEKVDTAVTDDKGEAFLCGIAYGSYYLIETKAPAGYNKLTEPMEVEVTAVSHDTEAEGAWNIVKNSQGFQLPSTGGMGTTLFYAAGGALVMAAGLLLVTRKRMRHSD